jgi:broad specificity phosphatase PhoE
MEIYLVRHGQTDGNLARRHQINSTRLTDVGRAQAQAAADAIKIINPDFFISSSMVRALETASIISRTCDMIPSTTAVFAELERPRDMYGYHLTHPRSMWFYFRWYFGMVRIDGTGAESYAMFRERVAAAQDILMKYPPDARIVVVSHSVFINFFIAHLCDKRPLNLIRAFWCFMRIFRTKNGSITKIVYTPSAKRTCAWRLEK